jgi:hypothetical protein
MRYLGPSWHVEGSAAALALTAPHPKFQRRYPHPLPPPLHSRRLVLVEGRFREAFVKCGTGCGARGPGDAAGHSGGSGAPPGPNTRPCQELADDRAVHAKRRPSPLSSCAWRGEAGSRRAKKDGGGTRTAKARPAAALIVRVWRAERRRRDSLGGSRGAIGFALVGAPPLRLEGEGEKGANPGCVPHRGIAAARHLPGHAGAGRHPLTLSSSLPGLTRQSSNMRSSRVMWDHRSAAAYWIPAFAGMTGEEEANHSRSPLEGEHASPKDER